MNVIDRIRRRLGLHVPNSATCWCRKCKRLAATSLARVRACGHQNMASTGKGDAYVCLDCGTGVIRRRATR